MPTGWRPADRIAQHPVYKIDDVFQFDKYRTPASNTFLSWVWFQLIVLLLLISYLFGNIAAIGAPDMYVYGLFIFLFVYALTELMDENRYALAWEMIKCGLGLYLLYSQSDWFQASATMPVVRWLLPAYFLLSAGITAYFSYQQLQRSASEYAT